LLDGELRTARLLEEKVLYTQHLCFALAARTARAANSLFPLDFWSAVQIPLKKQWVGNNKGVFA
jgi:hypothetical protein